MMKLFNKDKVKKLFSVLSRLQRTISADPIKDIYLGRDKNNPHISFCQKQIFIDRTIAKSLKNKLLIQYAICENTEIQYKRYLEIVKVSYRLGHGEEISVLVRDYGRPYDCFSLLRLDQGNILELEGEWVADDSKHIQVQELFVLDIPEKEYFFKAYHTSKMPDSKKEGQTMEDIYKIMEVPISFFARTETEAYQKKKIFESSDEFKANKINIINEIIEIRDKN